MNKEVRVQNQTKTDAAIKNIFNKYRFLQGSIATGVGVVPIADTTYTTMNSREIQLNMSTHNVNLNNIDVDTLFDFKEQIIDKDKTGKIWLNNNFLKSDYLDLSIEVSTDILHEHYHLSGYKFLKLIFHSDFGVIQLLFGNVPHKMWINDVAQKGAPIRNLPVLFDFMQSHLLFFPVGVSIESRTIRSRKVNFSSSIHQPLVSAEYSPTGDGTFGLIFVDSSITFTQDSLNRVTFGAKSGLNNQMLLKIDLRNISITLLINV